MRVKTIKVIGEDGNPLIINESAYDPEVYELCEGEAVSVEPEPEPESEPEPDDAENEVVKKHHGGGRWTVTVNGHSVHEGYLKKAEAEALASEY